MGRGGACPEGAPRSAARKFPTASLFPYFYFFFSFFLIFSLFLFSLFPFSFFFFFCSFLLSPPFSFYFFLFPLSLLLPIKGNVVLRSPPLRSRRPPAAPAASSAPAARSRTAAAPAPRRVPDCVAPCPGPREPHGVPLVTEQFRARKNGFRAGASPPAAAARSPPETCSRGAEGRAGGPHLTPPRAYPAPTGLPRRGEAGVAARVLPQGQGHPLL